MILGENYSSFVLLAASSGIELDDWTLLKIADMFQSISQSPESPKGSTGTTASGSCS